MIQKLFVSTAMEKSKGGKQHLGRHIIVDIYRENMSLSYESQYDVPLLQEPDEWKLSCFPKKYNLM